MSASLGRPSFHETEAHDWKPTARRAVLPATVAVLLSISVLGAGWLYVPANPVAKMPATTLTFNDLHDVAHGGLVPSNWIQQAYFGWLGWALAVAIVVLAVALTLVPQRLLEFALSAVAVTALVCTLLGVKGVLTWSQLADQIENIRLGGYLAVLGYVLALGLAVWQATRRS